MKGKNWRDFEPEKKQRSTEPRQRRKKRKRKKGRMLRRLIWFVILFAIGYAGFMLYYTFSKPYTIALDAGHGGWDVGAEGIINEVELTERTVSELEALLKEDGRFRIILSRKEGEGMSITERNQKFQKKHPDLMLSIHGNANDDSSANGFECYPSPPGYENHETSLAFAQLLAEEMRTVGAKLRGTEGVRFGYYNSNGEKVLVDSSDTEVYDFDTFGMLKNMDCPAVLVEQCFITNQADVDQFGTEDGCKKAAAAYYRAICRYLESIETIENA
ncbi:MAG: N-acetylmuramoyl-L-alanine amidase [Anaerotignum sp.]|nr:N-acetylmuramoyl-L-alanine amidase [Anaerotignum sp.]